MDWPQSEGVNQVLEIPWQKNLNIVRKFCLSILKNFKKSVKLSMNDIRFNIAMDFDNEIEKILECLCK